MKRKSRWNIAGLAWISAVCLLLVATGTAQQTTAAIPKLRVQVIEERPHDPKGFTQGFEIDDGRLYESVGLYGKSRLRELDVRTGQELRGVRLPDNQFAEGLTILDDKIYLLTWRENQAHVFDADTLKWQKTLSYEGEGWGLGNDGEKLIMSDGTDRLYFRDPQTFDVVSSVTVTIAGNPLGNLNELEYVDGYVYANVWRTISIAKIDPTNGEVVAFADVKDFLTPEEAKGADVLNGIAYDPATKTFLITGKNWPKMFQVIFQPPKK